MPITPKPLYFDRELPVFVGRTQDLINFNSNWKNKAEEYSVIKIANMPGIGKTEVVKQFYRTYGVKEKALMIYINCRDLSASINKIWSPQHAYKLTKKMHRIVFSQLEWYYEQRGEQIPKDLLAEIEDILSEKESFFSFIQDLFKLKKLEKLNKLFFFDEIQTLYGKGIKSILDKEEISEAKQWIYYHQDEEPEQFNCNTANLIETIKLYKQGAFREMSYMISTLISPYNLIFVSGTQYRLLNSLGDLGSPLLGRVTNYDLSRLSREESREWIDTVISKPYNDELWDSICETVIQLAGGIPRILQVYIDKLHDNLEMLVNNFSIEYKNTESELVKSANSILEQHYILFRINQLLDNFGDKMKRLLSRIAKHFMFHDYTTELEISTWIDTIGFKNKPHVSDIVEAGLLLMGNGNVVDDYTNHHSEQLRPKNPIVMVSKHIHNILRERFIEDIWLQEMNIQLDSDTLNILRIHPSVVGFAFEYYFALRILQLSQEEFVLIDKGRSIYFNNITKINNIRETSIVLNKLHSVLSYTSIDAIIPLTNNTVYLLSTEMAIDGLIFIEEFTILYQLKFTKSAPILKETFYKNIRKHEKKIHKKSDNKMIKILFTDNKPTEKDMNRLNSENILVCTDLELLLGERMIKWLRDSKQSKISI